MPPFHYFTLIVTRLTDVLHMDLFQVLVVLFVFVVGESAVVWAILLGKRREEGHALLVLGRVLLLLGPGLP